MWMNNKRWMRHRVPRCTNCGKRLSYINDEIIGWHFGCTNCGEDNGGHLQSCDYYFYWSLFMESKDFKVKMDSRCKPCPFCGEQPYRFYYGNTRPSKRKYSIGCYNHCIGTRFADHTNLEVAIADWNHQVDRKLIDGIYTCPWCGEVATNINKKTGCVNCNNPKCIAQPYISYRMTAESEVHETPEDWLNLWNGVKND